MLEEDTHGLIIPGITTGKGDSMKGMDKEGCKPYEPPRLTRLENIREITAECPQWQCSVVVPPPPS